MRTTATLEQLHDATKRMREAQKAWFAGDKREARLQECRALEREVDRILALIESPQGVLLG